MIMAVNRLLHMQSAHIPSIPCNLLATLSLFVKFHPMALYQLPPSVGICQYQQFRKFAALLREAVKDAVLVIQQVQRSIESKTKKVSMSLSRQSLRPELTP